jgi:hypothetical protein
VTKYFSELQESKDILVAVMAVFVAEPLVDWRNEALKRRAALGTKGRKGAVAALKEGDADEQMELVEQVRERRHLFVFCSFLSSLTANLRPATIKSNIQNDIMFLVALFGLTESSNEPKPFGVFPRPGQLRKGGIFA